MFSMKTVVLILLIVFCSDVINCAKILGIFMGLGRNHYILGKSFMTNLVQAGHDCVLISRYSDETNNGVHFKEVIVRNDESTDALFKATEETNHNPFFAIHRIHEYSKGIIPRVFEERGVKQLLNHNFDVVVIEEVFADALKVLAWHFKAHLVIFHPHRANFWVNDYLGNPCLPTFVTEYPATFSISKNFLERSLNLALYLYEKLYKEFVVLKEHRNVTSAHFPEAPDLSDIIYNTTLAFLNSDVAVYQFVPTLPNMVDIGGFHIDVPGRLPVEVQAFFDGSKKGVVYIDLDFLTSSYLSEETRDWMVEVLSEFEYDFLWVWDEQAIPNQPANLRFQDPLKLGNVLVHPNTKLFVHLGNTKDIIESLYYGVPQLLIPVLDDQLYDTSQAQYHGYARTLPFQSLTKSNFRSSLQELLNNVRYEDESKRRSKILKEKPISAKKAVVFWIDNVLKTKGAAYMRADSLDYSWYQLYMIDVIGFFIGSFVIVIAFVIIIFVKIWRICCCRSKRKSNKNKIYNSLSYIAE
ncbi:UDP-glycosyltransferase UGT5-like [Coccinella septempunctata]|uniref:UDP-glycosyltransferase UGT5-like n=1 Tax=Coccinella septempunctata TaxID=41139 RepID=UPI001D08954A|nr:UDP-glycosyltransferase UGT5-like [Coccinella septempunctata]